MVSFDEIQHVRQQLRDLSFLHWQADEIFSWNWWFLLIVSIIPWFMWAKWIDRKRLFEISTFGLFFGLSASILDSAGVDMLLWTYPDKLLPLFPPLFPADLTVIPIGYMAAYQYCRSWKSYFWVNAGLAFLFSYVFEPLFVNANLLKLLNWTHTYSFIGFILLGLVCKWIMEKLLDIRKAASAS
ncbi:CBO0543 family protein [Paenibacillus ginsengihumi]|uniref:CBO0543 family protein n=1 Tax=Paenibacillus ginsengihumi TaxID=431596 RepID=UPI0003679DD4|nr:CBO0543 family protein [Paenibacillus ginsengihumi]